MLRISWMRRSMMAVHACRPVLEAPGPVLALATPQLFTSMYGETSSEPESTNERQYRSQTKCTICVHLLPFTLNEGNGVH